MVLFILLSACGGIHVVPREVLLEKADFKQLQGWHQDNHLKGFETLKRSCYSIMKAKNGKISRLTDLASESTYWQNMCADLLKTPVFTNNIARKFFEKWFVPYKTRNISGDDVGKFTGYYELSLKGSRKKSKKYQYPVYKKPSDLEQLKGSSTITHNAINQGSLKGRNLEIAWVENKARLFFMQIQGSGIIHLDDGSIMKVGYDGQNGHPYKSIGPLFKDYCNTKIESAVDMMKWLHQNPKVGLEIMEQNESYVFFKEIYGDSPIGGQGVALTPERSMAIDHGLYPYGTPIWLETHLPNTKHYLKHNYHRLFIAQDTGGAIKGAVRGDIFFGRGEKAEEMAGYMNNKGSMFVFFPKGAHVPRKYKTH